MSGEFVRSFVGTVAPSRPDGKKRIISVDVQRDTIHANVYEVDSKGVCYLVAWGKKKKKKP